LLQQAPAAILEALVAVSPDQADALKLAFGRVMGELVEEIINPAIETFPGLEVNESQWVAIAKARAKDRAGAVYQNGRHGRLTASAPSGCSCKSPVTFTFSSSSRSPADDVRFGAFAALGVRGFFAKRMVGIDPALARQARHRGARLHAQRHQFALRRLVVHAAPVALVSTTSRPLRPSRSSAITFPRSFTWERRLSAHSPLLKDAVN